MALGLASATTVPVQAPTVGTNGRQIVRALNANFEDGIYNIGELPTEDWVGLGFGISLLLVVSVFGAWWIRGSSRQSPVSLAMPSQLCRWVQVAAWLSMLAYCMKSGLNTAPSGDMTVTLYINGIDALDIKIGSGTTYTDFQLATIIHYSAGDTLSLSASGTAGSAGSYVFQTHINRLG